jgi:hypothetical protein
MHAFRVRPCTRRPVLLASGLLCACVIGQATAPGLQFIALEGSVRSGETPLQGVEIGLFHYPSDMERIFIAGTVTDAQGRFSLRVATPSVATCRTLQLWATTLGSYVPGATRTGDITCTDQCQHFEFNLDRQPVTADYILFAERSACALN